MLSRLLPAGRLVSTENLAQLPVTSGGIQPVCTGSIEPSHKILFDLEPDSIVV